MHAGWRCSDLSDFFLQIYRLIRKHNSAMLYLLILFLALARLGEFQSSLVLQFRVLIIQLPYENATIPCDYTGEIKMFSWTRNDVNGDLVIKVNSAGNVKTGPEYNGSVELGDKCSLVFKSPGFKDNGTFVITAYNKDEYSEDVQVIVVNESAKLYSNAVRQGKRNVTESETDDICVGWKAGFGICCALFLCAVIAIVVIYKMRHKKGSNKSRGNRRPGPDDEAQSTPESVPLDNLANGPPTE